MAAFGPDRYAYDNLVISVGTVHIAFGNKNIFVEFVVIWDDKAKVFVLLETADQLAAAALQYFDNFAFRPAVLCGCEEAHLHAVHVQSAI